MDCLDSVSCGEVLLLKNGNLIVCCTLCDADYFAFHEYDQHVKDNHWLSDYKPEILDNYENDDKHIAAKQDVNTESYNELISADDLKMLEELEFIAPEPTNCKEIEDFVISYEKEQFEQNKNLANICPPKLEQKKKQSRRKYKCQQCDFTTLYLSSMRCHVQRRHEGIRRFKCQKCSKDFYTRTEVKNHMRTHTLERPYLCTNCGHTCVTSYALWRHRKSCNNIRDKECNMCDAKFAHARSLRGHMATHSDIRQFHCETCNAKFKLKKTLLAHIKIHENKREYKCKLCLASFNQAPTLSSHMRSKH